MLVDELCFDGFFRYSDLETMISLTRVNVHHFVGVFVLKQCGAGQCHFLGAGGIVKQLTPRATMRSLTVT